MAKLTKPSTVVQAVLAPAFMMLLLSCTTQSSTQTSDTAAASNSQTTNETANPEPRPARLEILPVPEDPQRQDALARLAAMDWPTEELDQDSLASVAEDFDETVEDARLRMRFQELFAQAVDRMIELHGAGVFSERRLSGPGEPLGARIRFVADVPDGTADVLAEHQIDHLVELLGQGGLSRLEVADLQARLAEHITTNNLGTGVIGSQLDDAGIVTIEVKLSPTDPTADATSIRSSLQGQIPDGVQLDLELI